MRRCRLLTPFLAILLMGCGSEPDSGDQVAAQTSAITVADLGEDYVSRLELDETDLLICPKAYTEDECNAKLDEWSDAADDLLDDLAVANLTVNGAESAASDLDDAVDVFKAEGCREQVSAENIWTCTDAWEAAEAGADEIASELEEAASK